MRHIESKKKEEPNTKGRETPTNLSETMLYQQRTLWRVDCQIKSLDLESIEDNVD